MLHATTSAARMAQSVQRGTWIVQQSWKRSRQRPTARKEAAQHAELQQPRSRHPVRVRAPQASSCQKRPPSPKSRIPARDAVTEGEALVKKRKEGRAAQLRAARKVVLQTSSDAPSTNDVAGARLCANHQRDRQDRAACSVRQRCLRQAKDRQDRAARSVRQRYLRQTKKLSAAEKGGPRRAGARARSNAQSQRGALARAKILEVSRKGGEGSPEERLREPRNHGSSVELRKS